MSGFREIDMAYMPCIECLGTGIMVTHSKRIFDCGYCDGTKQQLAPTDLTELQLDA